MDGKNLDEFYIQIGKAVVENYDTINLNKTSCSIVCNSREENYKMYDAITDALDYIEGRKKK
jgi:hypothetical protein